MRFAIIDPVGDALSWAARLHDEGHEVLYYVHERSSRDIGTNIVSKSNSLHQMLAWCKESPTIAFYPFSGMGSKNNKVPLGADDFRRAGVQVVGAGSFCDKLENDRAFGENIAKAAGCKTPKTAEFHTISQAIKYAEMLPDVGLYFKPSKKGMDSDATQGGSGETLVRYLGKLREKYGDKVPNIMQHKVPGVALSTAAWWNGRTFLTPFEGTIEHKKFMNDEIGPSTGCSMNVVWMYENSVKAANELNWSAFAPLFQKHNAPPCLYDINSIVSEEDGQCYFLEWTPRCGWDSEAASPKLLTSGLGEFLHKLSDGRLDHSPFTTDEIAFGLRITVPPYPFEAVDEITEKKTPIGAPIYGADGLWDGYFAPYGVAMGNDGELYCADAGGIIGTLNSKGRKLSLLETDTLEFVKGMEPKSLQYRTDSFKVLSKDGKELRAQGYEVPKAVVE